MSNIRTNAKAILLENYKMYSDKSQSLKEVTEISVANEPEFLSWLGNGKELTEEEVTEFVNSLEELETDSFLKVYKFDQDANADYCILPATAFKTQNLCECYDDYGQSCEDACGCDNGCTEVQAFTYWNGSNNVSLFLSNEWGNCLTEADEDVSREILEAYKEVETEYSGPSSEQEVSRFKFTLSNYASDPYIACVEII